MKLFMPENPHSKGLRWFITAFALYASFCLIFGWVRAPLFLGVGEDGWPAPSLGTMIYLLYMTCLPVALWCLIAYALACRMPGNWGMRLTVIFLLLMLTAIELDHAWYGMSGHHATWREARLFLSEDWKLHYGIRDTDESWFVRRMSLHLTGLIGVFIAARYGTQWDRAQKIFDTPFRRVIAVVAALFFVDILLAGFQISRGHDQWSAVADANPLRINSADRLLGKWFSYGSEHDADLEAANRAFIQATRDAMRPHPESTVVFHDASSPGRRQFDVVIVTIEGLNERLIDSTTMPFWTELSARSMSLHSHYSTGNVTEYGVLGVLYGAPPDFYRGTLTVPWRRQLPLDKQSPQRGSPYIDAFNQQGYHTRLISWELSSWANLGVYLRNFNEPAFETSDDWKTLPVLKRELSEPGSHLVYMHYNGTHFPYDHDAKYNRFMPEVANNYSYASWRMRQEAPAITNRYRNCLLELDSWLKQLTSTVDMQNTILVLTGDHGEEFFEHSRLGHASTLSDPQIQTVALIYVPGQAPRSIDAVTSHVDLMPTLMEVLGWPQPVPPFGRSLVNDVKVGAAIVAMGNRPNPPNRWAAIAGGYKTVLSEGDGDTLHIIQLRDTADKRVTFSADPSRWQPSFAAAAQLQLHLRSAAQSVRMAEVRAATP
ncbi:MAG TPA: sulfatase-like hydrolase/transferase [Gemmatimonadaceae bacterium]|nr:sulfatase-like hydrolase/transferase [Gemmatimonadaceae bacterium]